MYVPAHFEVTDTNVLHDVIVKHPLGTWIVSDGAELIINHIPFLLDPDQGAHGMLIGHVARANPVWKQLNESTRSAVVFIAEQGYISPNWYPGKQVHHRVVPTWNYAVVHAHGKARAVEDKRRLLQLVTSLTDRHEANRIPQWRVSDAPAEHVEKLLNAIVGIEMQIESLQGKFKLGQHQASLDREGAIAGLQASGNHDALALARRMQQSGK